MSIKVALHHRTHYQFDRNVQLTPHIIRLRPAPHNRTPIESYSMNIFPEKSFHQLAARSIWQFSGKGDFSRKSKRAID